jgi:hypothetical protein
MLYSTVFKSNQMNLFGSRANGDFRQWSLSIFGNPGGAKRQYRDGEAVQGAFAQEQMRRVLQPPKIRKIIAGPKGKIDFERENQTDSLNITLLPSYNSLLWF